MTKKALIILALIFSGSIQILISAPYTWNWLATFYLVPGLWAIGQLRGGRAFLGGWLLGIAANVTIFYWLVHTVQEFSNLGTPAAIGVLLLFGLTFGAYAGFFAWGFVALRRISGDFWPFAIAAWWVACEFLNPQLFPYYQGVIFYQTPWIFLIVTITGVPGVSFLVVSWNALLLWTLERWRRGEPLRHPALVRAAVVSMGLVAISVIVSVGQLIAIDRAQAGAESVRIALVQTNLDVETRRTVARLGLTAVIDVLLETSERAIAADPEIDVFVWPEGAVPDSPYAAHNRGVRRFVAEHGVEIWTGGSAHERTADGHLAKYNSAYRIFGGGEISERYDKNILLPFGEFMPLKETFPFLEKVRGGGRYSHGEGLRVIDTPHARFCFLICYEAIRHALVRENVELGANLLVNITYDAWFGDTACAGQHLMLAAIQSAQFGIPLVRAATTGISAVADPRGVLTHTTRVFVPAVLVTDVEPLRVPTAYSWLGDWFAWSCVAASFLLLVAARIQTRRQRTTAEAEAQPQENEANPTRLEPNAGSTSTATDPIVDAPEEGRDLEDA